MTELVAQFQTLPVSIINVILEWVQSRAKDIWYIQVDEKTGKLFYRHNVRLHAVLMEASWKSPLWRFINYRSSFDKSKFVTIYIDGEVIPAIEHCLKIFHDESYRRDDDYPQLYIEYERNKKMEYIECIGVSNGNDPTNPQTFNSCKLFRFSESHGQYIAHRVKIDHVVYDDDNTRLVTLEESKPLAYLHECRALADEYNCRRLVDRYARTTMITEMQEDPEIKEKMSTAMELLERVFNPYLNIYEHRVYNY